MSLPIPVPASASPGGRSMNYELGFIDEALAEWRALDGSVRAQFKSLLAERLKKLPVPAATLGGIRTAMKYRSAGVGSDWSMRCGASNWLWSLRAASGIAMQCSRPRPDAAQWSADARI